MPQKNLETAADLFANQLDERGESKQFGKFAKLILSEVNQFLG